MKKLLFNQKGAMSVLLLVAFVGILLYLMIAFVSPFKDTTMALLYPKPNSHAATTALSAEAENGTLSGSVSIKNDSNASNGKYIEFSVTAPSTAPVSPTPVKPGDVDGNNKVDIFDYNTLLTNFGKTGANIPGDLDKNGKVDIFDYNTLLSNFGK